MALAQPACTKAMFFLCRYLWNNQEYHKLLLKYEKYFMKKAALNGKAVKEFLRAADGDGV